jgi:hypothetical protein
MQVVSKTRQAPVPALFVAVTAWLICNVGMRNDDLCGITTAHELDRHALKRSVRGPYSPGVFKPMGPLDDQELTTDPQDCTVRKLIGDPVCAAHAQVNLRGDAFHALGPPPLRYFLRTGPCLKQALRRSRNPVTHDQRERRIRAFQRTSRSTRGSAARTSGNVAATPVQT